MLLCNFYTRNKNSNKSVIDLRSISKLVFMGNFLFFVERQGLTDFIQSVPTGVQWAIKNFLFKLNVSIQDLLDDKGFPEYPVCNAEYNRITLVGNVGKQPLYKEFADGRGKWQFSLATSTRSKTPVGEEWSPVTDWVYCV